MEGNNSGGSIIRIFNNMEYEEKNNKIECSEIPTTIFEKWGIPIQQKLNELISCARLFEVAVCAQDKWKSVNSLNRANVLHKICQGLKDNLEIFGEFQDLPKHEFLVFIDYFDFYSDLISTLDEIKNWRPLGIILILLSNKFPLFILGSIISGALGAGCSVIVNSSDQHLWFCLILEEIFKKAGLSEGLFNVFSETESNDELIYKKADKIIYCGEYIEAKNIFSKVSPTPFTFICPNNTAAIILESADVVAATDKILSETWGPNSLPMWGVSTVVIQESVYDKFLEELQFRLKQLEKTDKNSLRFKNKILLEKIQKISTEAEKAGAVVKKFWFNENEWGPTVILEHQNQNFDSDVPFLKVVPCRTAKEGATLINNSRYSIGTSIWTEISSQALEVASMLDDRNIWINSHGVIKANISLQPTKFSGNGVFGGADGIFEYMSFTLNDLNISSNENKNNPTWKIDSYPNNLYVVETIISAAKSFKIWSLNKNKKSCIKAIANSCQDQQLTKLSGMINYYAHCANILNTIQEKSDQEFYIVHKKSPIGVIAILINNLKITTEAIASLVIPAIAYGNTVILMSKEEISTVTLVIKHFNKFLPKNIINLIVGYAGIHYLITDPHIKSLWIVDESTISLEFQEIIRQSVKDLRYIWIVPKNLPLSQNLFQKECLKGKIVWLTSVDQFPL